MTPTETAGILRKFAQCLRADKYLWGASLPGVPAEVGAAVESAIEMVERLEATEEDRARFLVEMGRLCAQCDALHAKIVAMERQEPFDADSDVFRGAFEAALKAGNWPATRQGDGYRSPSTQIAWRIAFSTVNRMKLYALPGAKGE